MCKAICKTKSKPGFMLLEILFTIAISSFIMITSINIFKTTFKKQQLVFLKICAIIHACNAMESVLSGHPYFDNIDNVHIAVSKINSHFSLIKIEVKNPELEESIILESGFYE